MGVCGTPRSPGRSSAACLTRRCRTSPPLAPRPAPSLPALGWARTGPAGIRCGTATRTTRPPRKGSARRSARTTSPASTFAGTATGTGREWTARASQRTQSPPSSKTGHPRRGMCAAVEDLSGHVLLGSANRECSGGPQPTDDTQCTVYQALNADEVVDPRKTCGSFCSHFGLSCVNGYGDGEGSCLYGGEGIGCSVSCVHTLREPRRAVSGNGRSLTAPMHKFHFCRIR